MEYLLCLEKNLIENRDAPILTRRQMLLEDKF